MNKQYFNPEKDGFYGVYYPSPTPSRKAFIAMLGIRRMTGWWYPA